MTTSAPLQIGGTDRWRHMSPWNLHSCPACRGAGPWEWHEVYRAPEGVACPRCATMMTPVYPEAVRANDPTWVSGE